jgi:uncharacterized protein (DUF2252 family)
VKARAERVLTGGPEYRPHMATATKHRARTGPAKHSASTGPSNRSTSTATAKQSARTSAAKRKTAAARTPPPAVEHPTTAERAARGKAARKEVPRSSHAAFEPARDRPDPITLLERQARTRVPGLVPIRYGRMLVSPFTFYRGAALIMASDLAATSRSGLMVQCCGDAHLSNFGVFASPERRLVFDINDFDETLPGPWEWDVKRLAVSMLIAAQDNGFALKDQEQVVLDAVAAYRNAMASFAAMKNLEVWYAHLDVEAAIAEHRSEFKTKVVKRTEKNLAKARARDSMSAFSKLAERVDGRARIVAEPPLIVPLADLAQGQERDEMFDALHEILRSYRATLQRDRRVLLEEFELVDIARKVVGVGSVGTRAWILLLLGRDGQDPLFLQAKEADASVLEEFVAPSEFENHGERVVTGQHLMQASSDIFLGWVHVPEGEGGEPRDFYARQLKDWKGSAEVEQMDPKAMATYGRMCGWTLARAHARTGDRIAIASYLGRGPSFDRAILEFSKAYAQQNERDYEALTDAVKSGRIAAETGL